MSVSQKLYDQKWKRIKSKTKQNSKYWDSLEKREVISSNKLLLTTIKIVAVQAYWKILVL